MIAKGPAPCHRCIPIDRPEEWSAALEGVDHAFAHSWEWCRAMQLTSGLPTFLYVYEADGSRVVCPFVERQFMGYTDVVTPYGFSGFVGSPNPRGVAHWSRFAEERGYVCGYLGLHPVLGVTSLDQPHDVFDSGSAYVLDLRQSQAQLFASLSRNRRRQLRNWSPEYVEVGGPALKAFFIDHCVEFLRSHGASPVYEFSAETLEYLVELDDVAVVGMRDSGEVSAVLLFSVTPPVGECLFGISVPEGRHHATSLLWWTALHLKERRVSYLNLGGGVRDQDGIAAFKERFGPMRLALRCIKQVYRPDVYAKLCQRAGVDPDVGGYFPAYRAPEASPRALTPR